ncbi:WD40 repeat domain-containing protein [Aeoliella sp. SH292]|uniref:WD40 repeat domain-containing protein n=1 Tax=Aeoliella sp. SH292 TaxID=3454464 RepID=UPI003F95F847
MLFWWSKRSSIVLAGSVALSVVVGSGCSDSSSSKQPAAKPAIEWGSPAIVDSPAGGSQPNPAHPFVTHKRKADYEPVAALAPTEMRIVAADEVGKVPIRKLDTEGVKVTQVAFSRDSQFAVTTDDRGKLSKWMLADGSKPVSATVDSKAVIDLGISPDNRFAVTTHDDGRFRVWDLTTGDEIDNFRIEGSEILACQFTLDPTYVLLAVRDVSLGRPREMQRIMPMIYDLVNAEEVNLNGTHYSMGPLEDGSHSVQIEMGGAAGEFLLREGRWARFPRIGLMPGGKGKESVGYRWSGMECPVVNLSQKLSPTVSGTGIDIAASTTDISFTVVATTDGHLMFVDPQLRRMGEMRRPLATPCRDICWVTGLPLLAIYDGDTALSFYDIERGQFTQEFPATRTDVALAAISPNGKMGITAYANGDLHLITVPPPTASKEMQSYEFERVVAETWDSGDFEALEKIAAKVRKSRSANLDGFPNYYRFYQLLRATEQPTELQWKRHLKKLQEWMDQRPESSFAKIAFCEALVAYAWQARGTGYIGTVTEEGYVAFKDRLTQAAEILLETQELTDEDPALYELQIRVGQGLGLPKETLRLSFEAGKGIDSEYMPLYSSLSICLLPRWFGEPGELAEFMEEQATIAGPERGPEIYAWTFNQLKCFLDEAHLAGCGFDYDRVNEGAEALCKKYPQNSMYASLAAWTAVRTRDRDRAAKRLPAVGGQTHQHYFRDQNELARLMNWANKSSDSERLEWVTLADEWTTLDVAFSPDGAMVATGGSDAGAQLRLWDAKTGKLLHELPANYSIRSLDFHPTEPKLVTGGGRDGESELLVWTLSDEEVDLNELEAPPGSVRTVRFSPDGKRLAAGTDEGELWIWQKKAAKAGVVKVEFPGPVRAFDFLGDSGRIAVVGEKNVALVDAESGEVASISPLKPMKEGISIATTADRVYTGGQMLGVQSRDPATMDDASKVIAPRWPAIEQNHAFDARYAQGTWYVTWSLDVSPDGKTLAFATQDRHYQLPAVKGHRIALVDIATGRQYAPLLMGHCMPIEGLRFSPDGKRLASVSRDATVRVWNVENLELEPETPAKK